MITPYYIPKVVKNWKEKKAEHAYYTLYEVRPNGKRVYINTFYYRGTVQSEKADYENRFPWKKYCIVGGDIKCK